MQKWKVRKKLYQESWELKDMKYRIQLLREFVDDKYYIDNAAEYLDEALSNIELAMNSKQLKNAYEPLTKREKENQQCIYTQSSTKDSAEARKRNTKQ